MLVLSITAVFFSAIFCCCLTDFAQAVEPVPSCHQTEHETDTSQHTEECDCDQSLAIIKKEAVLNSLLIDAIAFDIKLQTKSRIYFSPVVAVFQAPPLVYDTAPLYIKHSILRI